MLKSNKMVYDVHLEDFDKKVLQASHDRPIVVDFWAEWCSPCLVIDPVLREVVTRYAGKVALARLEVDEGDNMKLAGRYQVRGFPTIILFHNAEVVDRFSSARPKSFIEAFIETSLERV
jgi:putative thioredoxin